ncbi:CehA/McbA family metallohydrolase, partial [Candidatus Latescibacterota bacterium]
YLNCGFTVMPSAGSASGVLPNPLGFNRVYVRVDGEFTYDNWFRALKAGQSFITNGPMLTMTVNDRQMGETVTLSENEAHVVCELYSSRPINRIEILLDGECVHTIEPELSDYSAVIIASIPLSESGWICARCFEDMKDNFRFAHTAPVFVTVKGKPFRPKRYAANYFLRKTREVIAEAENSDYSGEEAREAAMDVYRQALHIYEDLLQKSR